MLESGAFARVRVSMQLYLTVNILYVYGSLLLYNVYSCIVSITATLSKTV